MGKRKIDDISGEGNKKKNKKPKHSLLNSDGEKQFNGDGIDLHKSAKHSRMESGKQKKAGEKKVNKINQKPSSMQNLLAEKLKGVQQKRSEKAGIAVTPIIEETRKHVDKGPSTKQLELQTDSSKKIKRNKTVPTKKKENVPAQAATNVSVNEKINEDIGEDEELDPEKAAIREKKKQKRKQKKLDKLKLKEENASRAGSSQKSATEYLNQWKNNKSEWKFLKVRQVWLLQNMYDQKMVDDDNFEILLEYLEGLKGKSREATASGAEKIIEKSECEEDDSSSVKTDRARQIIQLLSD